MRNTLGKPLLSIAAALLALFALLLTPGLLFAQATVVGGTPAADSRLDTMPKSLELRFSTKPDLGTTSLELLDSAKVPMALGPVTAVNGDSTAISASILGALANGRYTVIWQTASRRRPTNGRYSFTVDDPQAPGASRAASPSVEIIERPNANPVVAGNSNAVVSTALRWAELVAVLILVGAVIYRLFIQHEGRLPPTVAAESSDRTRRYALGALALFFVATLTRMAARAQAASLPSTGRMDALLSVARETAWGHAWVIGIVGALLMVAGLVAGRGGFVGWVIAGLGVAGVATSEALTGHAGGSAHMLPLAVSVDVAHILGAGGWLGGLVGVMLAGLPALRPLDDDERDRAGSALVGAYHDAAIDSVTVVVITGLIAAWIRLGTLSALWTTDYGEMLARKIVAVIVLLGILVYRWRTATPSTWDAESKFRFQRSVTIELVVGGLVVVVTALLLGMTSPTH